MEFGWSKAQNDFRARVKGVIDEMRPADWPEIHRHGIANPRQAEFGRRFCARLAQEGLLVRQWPKEYGGEDGDMWDHVILGEEVWTAGEPRGPQYMNANWLGPALMKYATP